MGKSYPPHILLSVSDLFETKALFALGQVPPDIDALYNQLADSRFKPGYYLKSALSSMFHFNPTEEQWDNWISANQTVLGPYLNKDWGAIFNRNDLITCSAPGHQVYITNIDQPPFAQFDIASQAFLQASSPVPNLWIWVGEPITRKIHPPEVAHDVWLVDALTDLFSSGYGRVSAEWGNASKAKFIRDNKPVIDSIRRSFEHKPEELGSGADGIAYGIGKDRVLKIFKDQFAFTKAMEAVSRLHQQPHLAKTEAMIYDAGLLGRYERSEDTFVNVYYYIMEKMTPVRSIGKVDGDIRRVLSYITLAIRNDKEAWLDIKYNRIKDPSQHASIEKEVADEARSLSIRIRNSDIRTVIRVQNNADLKNNWLTLYIEEVIMKFLTGRGDLHMGNLGVTSNGELRYFDPAHNNWESGLNAPQPQTESDSNSPTSQS